MHLNRQNENRGNEVKPRVFEIIRYVISGGARIKRQPYGVLLEKAPDIGNRIGCLVSRDGDSLTARSRTDKGARSRLGCRGLFGTSTYALVPFNDSDRSVPCELV